MARRWKAVVCTLGVLIAHVLPATLPVLGTTLESALVDTAVAADSPWTLPTMPANCTKDQIAKLEITGCLVSSSTTPGQRGFGDPPFPWPQPGAPLPWSDLTVGASGHVVLAVQQALQANGVEVVVDGEYGSKTVTAVKKYQEKVALPATGIVDATTAGKLGVANSEPGPFPPPGFTWSGWGYNGSSALAEWEKTMVDNAAAIGSVGKGRLKTHVEVQALFSGFVADLVAGGYPIRDIGSYVFRCTSNSGKSCQNLTPGDLSNHAWGLALDMNSAANPEVTYRGVDGGSACAVPQKTDIPKWVVDAAQRWGLYWGGYGWSGGCKSPAEVKSSVLRDPMHFEFRGTVEQARAIVDFNGFKSTATRLCVRTVGDDGVERPACSDSRQPLAGWRLPITVGAPAGATAALVNIALTEATAAGFVTAESCGPVSNPARQWANGNFSVGTTVSNLAVVPLDAKGRFCLFASAPVQSIVDVQGFFVPSTQPGAAGFVAIPQQRVLDTRDGGQPRVDGGQPVALPSIGAVPANTSAVLLNTAVTGPVGAGYVTADRCVRLSGGTPTSANLNFAKDMTVANLAVVAVAGTDGTCLWPMVATHLVTDVQGAFVPGDGLGLSLVGPKRLVDTRGCAVHGGAEQCGVKVGAGQMVRVTGARGSAALVNLALTESSADLFAVADRCDVLETNRPLRANANTSAGRTISNLGVVPVAEDGSFCVWVSAPTHVVVDIQGVFEVGGSLRFVGQDPSRRHDTRTM